MSTTPTHRVHVIGIGEVYSGKDGRASCRTFKRWLRKANGKTVVRMVNGRIVEKQRATVGVIRIKRVKEGAKV
jgi:hypothetical protein